ncbi:hypothetical protein TrVE_jg12204 [Triparma verrucosa]|uniref:NADP-dependent oxidoreductase domain-containing protein n=1 Tax=Triparma verrucosa TaxID=1606542 RepID=A0A9W7EQM4_9STRA|nr:hypothetical protein TrVE_jg12204 [Triparma verrucosa]
MSSPTNLPRLYLGTMTFGWDQASSYVDSAIATEMIKVFASYGHRNIDTARIYSGGACEPIVATAIQNSNVKDLLVGTKAHPSQEGGLSPAGLQSQFTTSCEALQTTSVHEYYLHQPDPSTPLLSSLRHASNLLSTGAITHLGLSNFSSSEVSHCLSLCREHSLPPPTLYQGLYNPLNRLIEPSLLPLLHSNNISFIAYNPLAGGLLTGSHTSPSSPPPGRFNKNPNYLPRFYTPPNFHALSLIKTACKNSSISLIEATYSWLLFHSSLTSSDGLLIGASNLNQLKQNLKACTDPKPLSQEVINSFDEGWDIIESSGEAFKYWRGYSSDMPGKDSLDHGSVYSANKTK